MNFIRIEREPDYEHVKRAYKWNFRDGEYEDIEIEGNCSYFTKDMKEIVRCAQCKHRLEYGDCYTSRQIHTEHGFGYAVCSKCYEKEWEEEMAVNHE